MIIVTEFGVPHVANSLEGSRPLNRLAVMKRTWLRCFAFDAHQRYRCLPSYELSIGAVQRLLARVCYNPRTEVVTRWEPAGSYVLADIVAEVERGLETDDDIIQQWFGADDVLKLLRSATTFQGMADAIRCVCGEFESDARLQRIVDGVLGQSPDSEHS